MTEYLFPTASLSGDDGSGALGALGGTGLASDALHGLDIASLADLDPQLRLVGGRILLAQDLAHRFETPEGGLFYDDSYGHDLRAYLNAALDESDAPRITAACETQCLLDERVLAVRTGVTLYRAENRLEVAIAIECAEGPFSFVLAVSPDLVSLLFAQAA